MEKLISLKQRLSRSDYCRIHPEGTLAVPLALATHPDETLILNTEKEENRFSLYSYLQTKKLGWISIHNGIGNTLEHHIECQVALNNKIGLY